MNKYRKVTGRYVNSKINKSQYDEDDRAALSDLPEKLGFLSLAKNLKNSLIIWHRSGRPIVTSQEWDVRLSLCRSCEYWEEFSSSKLARCKKCGCSSGKLLLKTSRCPLPIPKW